MKFKKVEQFNGYEYILWHSSSQPKIKFTCKSCLLKFTRINQSSSLAHSISASCVHVRVFQFTRILSVGPREGSAEVEWKMICCLGSED